jgi:hypothetical protein
MDEIKDENLFMQHTMALLQRATNMQEEYLTNMRRMYMNMLLWNDLTITITEIGFNSFLNKTARWSDAGTQYQDKVLKAIQPPEKK